MNISSKLKTFGAVAGACAALFAAAPASAYVYALSHVEIKDQALLITGPSTSVSSYTFNLTNTATFNGDAIASATCNQSLANACSVASPVLDAQPANAPGNTAGLNRTNNNFSFLGTAPAGSYSGADSVIRTAELVQGVLTNTEQIAESLLNVNGTAAANAEIKSNTTLSWTVQVGGPSADLALSFMADADLRVAIQEALAGAWSSQANSTAVFQLTRSTQTGGGFVTWSPTGTGTTTNNCFVVGLGGVTCSVTADDFNLQEALATGDNPDDQTNSTYNVADIFGSFGVNVLGLPTGTYTIALSALTSTLITREAEVPEPGTLALVGLALAGLGLSGARRRAKLSA